MGKLKEDDKIFIKDFIPERVVCKNSPEKSFNLNLNDEDTHLNLSYTTKLYNLYGLVGKKSYKLSMPRFIKRNKDTFEVLGLLQAEMGKKHDGKICFSNHEYQLINKVVKWFEDEFKFKKEIWKWYIKININEPVDKSYKEEVENKVINYWLKKSSLSISRAYPKRVSYIKNTKNKILRDRDYGNLIIEKGSNLFSQIIKSLVKKITESIIDYENKEIRAFMRGIIAGESTVEVNLYSGHYRVFITAVQKSERDIYEKCLKKLGIPSKNCESIKDLIISRKENNLKLLKQDLMTLSSEKYNKFEYMIKSYQDYRDSEDFRKKVDEIFKKG